MAAELALWQQRLMPFAEDLPSVAPPPELWQRIQAELGFTIQRKSFPAATSQVAADLCGVVVSAPEWRTDSTRFANGQHAVIGLLSDTVMQAMSGAANLAVSVEPVGGFRTGQPTGPIVAQGAIRGA